MAYSKLLHKGFVATLNQVICRRCRTSLGEHAQVWRTEKEPNKEQQWLTGFSDGTALGCISAIQSSLIDYSQEIFNEGWACLFQRFFFKDSSDEIPGYFRLL